MILKEDRQTTNDIVLSITMSPKRQRRETGSDMHTDVLTKGDAVAHIYRLMSQSKLDPAILEVNDDSGPFSQPCNLACQC
jgi:hypothetical protein